MVDIWAFRGYFSSWTNWDYGLLLIWV